MSKLLKELTKFFTKETNTLEAFLNAKEPTSHAEVEYWTRYYNFNRD
jgi:ABC-type Zn uptake system ZnuABC Zn-binding protein ZnuA